MPAEYSLRPDLKAKYKLSISATDAEFSVLDKEKRVHIVFHLVQTCEDASRYLWEPENKARAADIAALKQRATAANSAAKLSMILKGHPQQFGLAVSAASLESKVFLRKKDDAQPTGLVPGFTGVDALRLAELLNSLDDALRERKILAKAGPMIHRTRCGPLNFARPIDNQSKLPDPETCLAVYLSAELRSFDLFGNFNAMVCGAQIPRDGRPRWSLVEQWVQDTYPGAKPAEAKAVKLLNRHKDLEVWGYR